MNKAGKNWKGFALTYFDNRAAEICHVLSDIEKQTVQLKAKLSKEEDASKALGLKLNDVRVEFACTVSELVDANLAAKSLQVQNGNLQNELARINHEREMQTVRSRREIQTLKQDLEAQQTRAKAAEERLEVEMQRTKAAEDTVNMVLDAALSYTKEDEDDAEESSPSEEEEDIADDASNSTYGTMDETVITAYEDDPTVALLPKVAYDNRTSTKYSFTEDEVFHFKKSHLKLSNKPSKLGHKTRVDKETPTKCKMSENMLLQLLTPLSN